MGGIIPPPGKAKISAWADGKYTTYYATEFRLVKKGDTLWLAFRDGDSQWVELPMSDADVELPDGGA